MHFIIKACINPFSVFLKHMQINVSFKVTLNYVWKPISSECILTQNGSS